MPSRRRTLAQVIVDLKRIELQCGGEEREHCDQRPNQELEAFRGHDAADTHQISEAGGGGARALGTARRSDGD